MTIVWKLFLNKTENPTAIKEKERYNCLHAN